jgi:hypothetical protein
MEKGEMRSWIQEDCVDMSDFVRAVACQRRSAVLYFDFWFSYSVKGPRLVACVLEPGNLWCFVKVISAPFNARVLHSKLLLSGQVV